MQRGDQDNSFSGLVLRWYHQNRRDLPWRANTADPYAIWLSEIMLQQTTVTTVIPYYKLFLEKWPTMRKLAEASLDEILTAWQGLGYYSRARLLYQCAKIIQTQYKGIFPRTEEELLKLPGIGPYTAAAIASIAFEEPAIALDGNVLRLLSRYFTIAEPRPEGEKLIKQKLKPFMPPSQLGDFTQGLIELGALICRPKQPLCLLCPLSQSCKAYYKGAVADYPPKKLKKKLPVHHTAAFILRRNTGEILLEKRQEKGLLGGMLGVPTTPWHDKKQDEQTALAQAPLNTAWAKVQGDIKHTFTHFHLFAQVYVATMDIQLDGIWAHPLNFRDFPLPTVMKKIIHHGLREYC